jgi:hypothetical protein
MDYLTLSKERIPIVAEYDVFVAGGGCAGVGAGVAAARSGMRTLIAERMFCLGGTLTGGLMSKIAILNTNHGFGEELLVRLDRLQGSDFLASRSEVPVDPEAAKRMLDRMVVEEAGAEVLFGTAVAAVARAGRRIEAVVVNSINGLEAIRAKYYIDCTGDAQLGFRAGAACLVGDAADGYSSAPTLMFRVGNVDLERLITEMEQRPELRESSERNTYSYHRLSPAQNRENIARDRYAHFADFVPYLRQKARENPGMFSEWELSMMLQRGILFMNQPQGGHVLVNCTRTPYFRGDDKKELTEACLSGRRQAEATFRFMKAFLPGFEGSFLMDTGSMLGVRESRRLVGDYVLTEEDVETYRKFPDVVVSNQGGVEIHGTRGKGTEIRELRTDDCYHVPYRCVIARDFDNLFMAGRCFSADHPALSAARNISYCMALGQATGNAAAQLIKRGAADVREIDIPMLQETLRDVI